jgi:hypothetical protein
VLEGNWLTSFSTYLSSKGNIIIDVVKEHDRNEHADEREHEHRRVAPLVDLAAATGSGCPSRAW